jgi:hypothetical protein
MSILRALNDCDTDFSINRISYQLMGEHHEQIGDRAIAPLPSRPTGIAAGPAGTGIRPRNSPPREPSRERNMKRRQLSRRPERARPQQQLQSPRSRNPIPKSWRRRRPCTEGSLITSQAECLALLEHREFRLALTASPATQVTEAFGNLQDIAILSYSDNPRGPLITWA